MSQPFILEVQDLKKDFFLYHLNKEIKGIDQISFQVKERDFLGIVGPSGSGKSTIIKCIYGAYKPTSGHIYYQSSDFGRVDLAQEDERLMMALRRGEIGYVSQFLDIMPRVTSFDLVLHELLNLGLDRQEAQDKAAESLKHFGIAEGLWYQYPRTFSGGEKLRLNLARTLVKQPRLLLLDEPTASLDQASKEKVRESIIQLKVMGTTMIGIFHDLEFMEGLITDCYHMRGKEE
ncbi:phosphonate C-P lyase system protein PhnL [Vaginisenegalia massiliensis]|uniref:phosphonate C-P lyase system protein PhnL n=1 Tax=Vaginisenegalia massiliensis TaxID=2058294 RepID=UPI000F52453A|nr:ATP-binding cassette domain-containing protein [Vaginisenegalia massiliensis]